MKRLTCLILLLFLFSACTPSPKTALKKASNKMSEQDSFCIDIVPAFILDESRISLSGTYNCLYENHQIQLIIEGKMTGNYNIHYENNKLSISHNGERKEISIELNNFSIKDYIECKDIKEENGDYYLTISINKELLYAEFNDKIDISKYQDMVFSDVVICMDKEYKLKSICLTAYLSEALSSGFELEFIFRDYGKS